MPQQQFGQPVPGTHQIPAAVLADTNQVPRGLLPWRRNGHRMNLADAQQPSQIHGVFRVGLDPVT